MTKDIFQSPEYQSKFREEGYVILPLLNEREIKQLTDIYISQESNSQVQLPFYTSIWSENIL